MPPFVLPCISCVAQFNFELPAEIERTICWPSGGAALGHFEDEDEAAACWVDVIVAVADGVLVLLMFSTILKASRGLDNEIGQRFFHQKRAVERCWKLQKLRFSHR